MGGSMDHFVPRPEVVDPVAVPVRIAARKASLVESSSAPPYGRWPGVPDRGPPTGGSPTLTACDDDQLAPEAVLYRLFDLWERVPEVIARTSFVLHLVIEECEARGWTDQCERVIEYALAKQIELPLLSTIKIMDRYAARGDFDNAIHLGELVLQPRLEKIATEGAAAFRKSQQYAANSPSGIPDTFFESLLRCYLFRERFEDVVHLDEAFQLTARRSDANAALATILRDARSMVY